MQRGKYLSAFDLAGLHATGANISLADMTVFIADRDFLNVGLEPTIGYAVGVADIASRRRSLAANLANLRHFPSTPKQTI